MKMKNNRKTARKNIKIRTSKGICQLCRTQMLRTIKNKPIPKKLFVHFNTLHHLLM